MQEILNAFKDTYKDRGYLSKKDAESIIERLKQPLNLIRNMDDEVDGFYIKDEKDRVLTVYVHLDGFKSGYSLQISVTDLGARRKVQIGGGYGTSGFDFTKESYIFRNELQTYSKKKTVKLLESIIKKFNGL